MNFTILTAVFSLTLFVSAGFLFLVEPMVGKIILPLLGGTPAVWNTCIMFFQAMLLAGYGYAHLTSKYLSFRRQLALHGILLLLACVMLPVGINRAWILPATNPIATVLILLSFSVSLPFFVLSSSAPLLQKWFAQTGHPSAKDPYFLYSASNLGSVLALLAYPTIMEPSLTIKAQSILWAAGYGLFAILTLTCAVLTKKSFSVCFPEDAPRRDTQEILGTPAHCIDDAPLPTLRQRLSWLALAFIPSSLMLGVTTFFTTDIAAIPLFWIVPLTIYLLTFIITFARTTPVLHRIMIRLLPPGIILLLFYIFSSIDPPVWFNFLIHLSTFFIAAMVCHGELARSRPSTRHLTEFYLIMSLGGVLGGVFNALIAPVAFSDVAEYPIALCLAALFIPAISPRIARVTIKTWLLDIGYAILLGLLTVWLVTKWPIWEFDLESVSSYLGMKHDTLHTTITFAIPALLCYAVAFVKRPVRFGLAVAAFALACTFYADWGGEVVHKGRSFFGVLTVYNDTSGKYRSFLHGTTLHGKQSLDPETRLEPLTYFHRQGPVGQLLTEFSGEKAKKNVAVLGLGIGTLAAYGEKGQDFTFYEIDPAVKDIAANPVYFTFLQNCEATYRIVLGDGRLKIEEAGNKGYGLIILDAFSSDAIPVHLLTREALHLYLTKLEDTGIIVFNITNGYLSAEPLLESLAKDAGLAALLQDDGYDKSIGKFGSKWVIMSRSADNFGNLRYDDRWQILEGWKSVPVWTDDFSNILGVIEWR